MQSATALRVALVLEWTFGILSIVLTSVFEGQLPSELQSWLSERTTRDPSQRETAAILILLLAITGSLVGSLGLMYLQSWAAWVYLGSALMAFIAIPFLGPNVSHAVPDCLAEIGMFLSGIVVGLAFFSDALPTSSESV